MRKIILFEGFVDKPPKQFFSNLIQELAEEKIEIIDFLRKERGKKSFIAIGRDSKKAIKETMIIWNENRKIRPKIIIAYSYGIVPAIYLANQIYPKQIVLICCPLAPDTLKWNSFEKPLLLFPKTFPGYAEMESDEFWLKIWNDLYWLKTEGVSITFVIPPVYQGHHQDGRIKYSKETIEKMNETGRIAILPIGGHLAAVKETRNIELIKTIIKK